MCFEIAGFHKIEARDKVSLCVISMAFFLNFQNELC